MTWYHPKYYRALRAANRKQRATSEQQAQPEVVLDKKSIDKDPVVGYYGTDDVTAIHGGHSSARLVQPKATSNTGDAPHMGPRNSAAETLHLEQHKYPGDGSSRMVQGYGPSSLNQQATSNQQASKVSSTVDHDPRATDEQAKPSLKRS